MLRFHRLWHPRTLATVSPSILRYSEPPLPPPPPPPLPPSHLSALDSQLLSALDVPKRHVTLSSIIEQYVSQAGSVQGVSLPYESRPPKFRRPSLVPANSDTVMVAHCVRDGTKNKVTISSGFALEAPSPFKNETLILTCAHTLEDIRRSPLLLPDSPALSGLPGTATGTFCVTHGSQEAGNTGMTMHPVTGVVSALPKSDLLLLSCMIDKSKHNLKTLPVSPYPARAGATIRARFVSLVAPLKQDEGWQPWIGGTWSRWASGSVLGYRDFAGRETEPGTYDALSHLLFSPPPTHGSSGGPIIEEESGAVIGVMLGSIMDNRLEGVRGWGVPSETIYEMFTLPGLEGKE